jgi:hypothetical protein
MVMLEILGGNAERVALDPRVDVLGNENGACARGVKLGGNGEDSVVGLVEIERELADELG